MTLSLSNRGASIEQAEIRAMSIECEKVGGINLAQGVCDTQVPLTIRKAACIGIENGINSYTRFDGLAQLREAIAKKCSQYNRINANPETDIVVSAGSTGAFYCACLALLDAGDEVILFEPVLRLSREYAARCANGPALCQAARAGLALFCTGT